jgi:iron complex outermembrane receptor protein
MTRGAGLCVAAVICNLTLSTFAVGQQIRVADESTSDASAPQAVQEIVVTAQRRSERLQDVPISVTALTASAIENAHIDSVKDVAFLTPGLTMTTTLGTIQPYIRGVGTQNTAAGEESSVSTYVDGVYIGAVSGTNFALPDVERIEVLKGPQGTLFGRNATGGLIQVITKDPSSSAQVQLNLEGANYGTYTTKAYAAGGLGEQLAASVAAYFSDQTKGWGINRNSGEEANRSKEYLLRGKLVWNPGDNTKITLALDDEKLESDIGVNRQLLPGTVSLFGVTPAGGLYDSRYQ